MKLNKFVNYLKENYLKILLYLILTWFIVSFILYPNINLVIKTFYSNGRFSTETFDKLVSSEKAVRSLKNSFLLATSLSITINILGVFTVLVTEFFDIRGSKFLKIAYMSTLVYGGLILAAGYRLVYGETGIITSFLLKFIPNMSPQWFIGFGAVLFTMTFAGTSNHLIFLTNAIRGIDYQVIEAAQNMGAKNTTIVTKVLLPMLKPTLYALTILVFLSGLGATAVPLMIGGTEFQTINPMIIILAQSTYSRDIAMLLSIILGLSTIILLTYMNMIERKGNYISISKAKTLLKKQNINNPVVNLVVHILAYLVAFIYILPMLIVIVFSFMPTVNIISGKLNLLSFTLEHYKKLFVDVNSFKPYIVSFIYSGLATLSVIIIALVISRITHKKNTKISRFFEYSALIPWLLPGTLIALGLTMTYNTPKLLIFKQVLLGTPIIMIIAYIVVQIPFAFRMIRAAFFSVDSELEEAAKSMGATTFYTFIRVILPILLPTALAVGALIFNALLSDYNLSVFLYHPLLQPLGIAIYKNTISEVDLDARAMVYVYSVTMMIISSFVIYYVYGRKSLNKK